MNLKRKILVAILIPFVGIQLIRPAPNKSEQVLETDIVKMYNVPVNVQNVLKTACYDCHSNNTNYPWYVMIQPVGWMMERHIKSGKENLSFSEFGSYSKRKQAHKLRAIATSISEGSMPISSYKIMHADARLNKEKIKLITDWAWKTKDSIDVRNLK